MLNNLPLELRQLPQWVCVDMSLNEKGHPKKHPICPRDGKLARVNDPSTWGTFEECLRTGNKTIGFVLTRDDQYTLIDIDDKEWAPATPEQRERHKKILEAFDSYTERSVSGTGYHIIVKGSVPQGLDRDRTGVYSCSRYMIMSGDVVRNSPITDQQRLLDILYDEMRPNAVEYSELVNYDATSEDLDIVERAMYASNADKFNSLCRGEWEEMGYTSQSEADLALLAILCFYSISNEQVLRLFRMSNLGKREKATKNDVYLMGTIRKVRAKQPPLVDTSALLSAARKPVTVVVPAPTPQQAAVVPAPLPVPMPSQHAQPARAGRRMLGHLHLPQGLVGDVAEYIFQTSVRPVPEVSLMAAIAITAGVCGRSYNISNSGLNQYLILVAKTGSGKEGAASGIDNLLAAVRQQIPMVEQFIGPAAFASGQSLIRMLDERPCFVSVLGEFGITLKQVSDAQAHAPLVMLKKVMLDLYSKSGWNKMLRPSVYADQEKNTKTIQAPNVTIFGETTPINFFEGLELSHIDEGLIPRFSVMEYLGDRPDRNENANVPPSADLTSRFADLVTIALTTAQNRTCGPVMMAADGKALLDKFDKECDKKINDASGSVVSQLWNRAHLKALKLAALVAVGVDMHNPAISLDSAKWAIEFVRTDISVMTSRFDSGSFGAGESKQEADIRDAVAALLAMTVETKRAYQVPESVIESDIIPFGYIRRRCRLLKSFKEDRRGAARAIQDSLADLCKANILQLIPQNQSQAVYGIRSELYIKGESW